LSALCSLILSAYADQLEKRDLHRTIKTQGDAAKDLIDEINIRYNNALLAQEMGETTSKVLEVDRRMDAIRHVMERRLDFDGGFILLANGNKNQLSYAAGYGLEEKKAVPLQPAAISLDDNDSNDLFLKVFRQQKPALFTDSDDIAKIQSMRPLEVLDQLEVRSLICVPIIYEQESLGILTVFHTHIKRPLTKSDSNLLTGLASQAAVIINNAMSFHRLRESEERYRTILESIEDGYYEVDIAGNFTFFNDAVSNILGYTRVELMGMNNRQYTDEKSAKELYQAFNRVYTTGEPVKGFDWVVTRKDGSKRFVEASVSLKRDSAGTPIGFRGIVRDITKRKQAEDERILLEARLQRSKKMEALGTLAGGVAHDLNNILSGLVSYPELLLLDLPPESPLKKPILTIKKSGEKAATIVQDLLTLARRGVFVTDVVDLNHVISEYLKSPECERLKQYHPTVRIETRLHSGMLLVQGSPVHLSKTIMNLVSNAAEAITETGEVLITTEHRYLDPKAGEPCELKEGEYVVLKVADTGMGISPEDLERIFEPFYTKKVMGRSGTGLGMAVVWGTVKDHKGAIDIRSTPQKGTEFTLYFPMTSNALPAEKPKTSMEDYMGAGESVLIVDDVKEQREIASEMLMKLGYSVTSVSCGEEAIEHMKTNTHDLVVLDMIMDPKIDGLETYERILDLHPSQKAIIASGYSETERVKKALELGAGAYLRKPYTLERLGVAVSAQLETDRRPEN
jgi:PAS domain S-box-containing protein